MTHDESSNSSGTRPSGPASPVETSSRPSRPPHHCHPTPPLHCGLNALEQQTEHHHRPLACRSRPPPDPIERTNRRQFHMLVSKLRIRFRLTARSWMCGIQQLQPTLCMVPLQIQQQVREAARLGSDATPRRDLDRTKHARAHERDRTQDTQITKTDRTG